MEIINIKYNNNVKVDKYFKNNNICFLDIETTGFNRNNNIIYLVGVLYKKNSSWYVKQFFANSISKEKELILNIASFLEAFDTIITYNGNNFDINFLNYKFRKYNLKYSLNNKTSFDIYQIIRRENLFLNLNSLKLESIEEYIGINRKDTLSGKDCIKYYFKYVNTRKKKYKDLILQHNYEDLIYLPYILKIIDIIKEKKTINIFFGEKIIGTKIKSIKLNNHILNINCYIPNLNIEPIIIYEKNYNLSLEPENNSLKIDIELEKGLVSTKETCWYFNIKNTPYENKMEDKSEFNLPDKLIAIKIDRKFEIENIKNLIKNIVETSLQNSLI